MTTVQDKRLRIIQYTLIVGFILLMIGLQRHAYGERNYRQDEINTIHAAKIMSPSQVTVWMATNIHPPAWRLLADSWVDAFGDAESVVRWSSVLANLLTFAFLFRLGTDLLDWKLGLLAIILLGFYPIIASFMNELRPYPYLIMLVTGLHLFFLRWIRYQQFRYMLLYIIFGILGLYTHYYAIYVFPAHLIYFVLTVRWNPSLYRRTFGMWVLIALSFAGWLIPFIHSFTVRQSGGIYYALSSEGEGFQLLYRRLRFKPEELGQFLFLFGLATPFFSEIRGQLRAQQRWSHFQMFVYPISIFFVTLIIALGANTIIRNVTARNMMIIMPMVVLLMSLGLRALPRPAHVIMIVLLIFGTPRNLPIQESNGPYREITETMESNYQSDSMLITEFETAWQWLMPAAYGLMDFAPIHMSKQQMYHLIDQEDRAHSQGPPDRLVNVFKSFDAEYLDDFARQHSQLWVLEQGAGNRHGEKLNAWLSENYSQIRSVSWEEDYPTTYTLSEYVRLPDDASIALSADDIFDLYSWTLKDSIDVAPCQTITIESWWQSRQKTDVPFSLVLILADDSGQVAFSEDVPADLFTTEWQTNIYYRDLTELTVPCDIAEGNYNLLLGMKNSITGESSLLTASDGNEIGTLYYLTTLNAKGN